MTLHLHDTATRSTREFTPAVAGEVSIYVCGATVQGAPHIGHTRSAVCFDILQRWLEFDGYDVTLIRNVTDIDDKILAKAEKAGVPWWSWAYTYERAFDEAYALLGVKPPTYAPRATGHVPEMVALMQRLIDGGHAYASEGSVYFDVGSWADYGKLSGQRPDEIRICVEPVDAGKRDSRDFALWKAAQPGEPGWVTPWGTGRPGWHLECSAMAEKYCGAAFDIHGGGLDLIFPHHENEMAQSTAAGDGFARYWMHNNWVTTAGEKMSKSLGNSLLVTELVKQVRPIELRYYLGAAHYRSVIEYSASSLSEAATGFQRIESFLQRATSRLGTVEIAAEVDPRFRAAMEDDLAVPAALAVLHETVTAGNRALDHADSAVALPEAASARLMAQILGIDPLADRWVQTVDDSTLTALDTLARELLERRAQARADRDFETADAIRDTLDAAGIAVADGPEGSTWSITDK